MAEPGPFLIKVPCSSANLGPGFDVIGLALDVYLSLRVSYNEDRAPAPVPLNFRIASCDGVLVASYNTVETTLMPD